MSRPAVSGPLTFVIVASLSALTAAAMASSFAPPSAGASEDRLGSPGASAPVAASGDALPAYETPAWPDGFQRWAWVKSGPSGALMGQPAGTHHIYANALAMEGLRTGRYADGAVLVFDVLSPPDAASGEATDPATRLRTDVMVRDGARYASTGGWGYGEWLFAAAADGGSGKRVNAPAAANPGAICQACHVRLAADRGFVVSRPEGS